MQENEKKTRKLPSLIDSFCEYTRHVPTTDLYRRWAGISMVAGMLERRCYAKPLMRPVYPNMYILLVAPPGIGKSTIISEVSSFWRKTESLFVAPNSVTAAALVDQLRTAGHTVRNIKTMESWTYHSLCIASEEFGNLITAYDMAFMSAMCEFYDCVQVYSEIRRGRKKEEQPDITNPQVHMLAGTQPKYLDAILPEAAWGQGFMSRNIMIYAGTQEKIALFTQQEPDKSLERKIISDLCQLSNMSGEFRWTKEASEALLAWYDIGLEPSPQHLKLENYKPRRLLHFVKLCMVLSASRDNSLSITLQDHTDAMELLLTAEEEMPQVFQAMKVSDDAAIISEVYTFVLRFHSKSKKVVPRSLLIQFLGEQLPLYRIENFLQVLEAGGILRKAPGGYTPGKRSKFDNI